MAQFLIKTAVLALLLTALASNSATGQQPVDAPAAEVLTALPRLGDLHDELLPPGSKLRLGTVRFRHGEGVLFVRFLGDGTQLFTASKDGLMRVWDVASGKELRRWKLPGHGGGGSSSYSDGVVVVVDYRVSGLESTLLEVSPDGQLLASMGYGGPVDLWDMATGNKVRQLRTRGGYPDAVAFAPDSQTLATRGNDQVIRIYDVATGQERKQLGKAPDSKNRFYFGRSRSLAYAPDGKTLASLKMQQDDNNNNSSAHLMFWDVETGKVSREIPGPENAFNGLTLSYSADRQAFLVVGDNTRGIFYDPATGKQLHQLEVEPNGYGSRSRFSRDGKILALQHLDTQQIELFAVGNGKRLRTLGEARRRDRSVFYGDESVSQTVDFSPDGRFLAVGTDDAAVRLWDLATGKEITRVGEGHQTAVTATAVVERTTLMTVAGGETLRHWDLNTGQEKRSVTLPAGTANAIFSPDGRLLALGSLGNKLLLWDPIAGKELHSLKLAEQQFRQMAAGGGGMAFAPHGKTLAVRDYDGTLRLFDTATGKETSQFPVRVGPTARGDVVIVNGIAPAITFSGDGRLVALASKAVDPKQDPNRVDFSRNNNVIRVWHVPTGKLLREFGTRKTDILALAVSPDGRCLAAATADNAITLWETLTGKERCRYQLKQQDFFGKVGAFFSGGSAGEREYNLSCLAFSQDGRTLVAGGKDRTLYLWDVASAQKLGQYTGHHGAVRSVAFLPDGQSLVSTSVDSTALVWEAGDLLRRPAAPGVLLEDKQLETLWNELAGDQGTAAHQAISTLCASPAQAIDWLRPRLQPTPPPDRQRIEQLIKELDGEQFQTRQKAEQELEKLAELAEPALKKVLAGKPTLEMQQRVEKLLERLVSPLTPPAELVQQCRALEILERLGTAEARQVLDKLTQGAAGHRLTVEAQQALQRLGQPRP